MGDNMLKEIEIKDEKELEHLIVNEPSVVEEGLKIIKHQLPTDAGPSDIICVDENGRVGIMELKILEEDYMLLQAFKYFDYINENLDAIKNMFPNFNIDPEKNPRILLIAPSFSSTLMKAVKNISEPTIELFRYFYLEEKTGKKELFCKAVEITGPRKPVRIVTLEDHIEYIRDESLRNLCKSIINKIKGIGPRIEVNPTQFYIGLQFKGRLIARIHTFRERFDFLYPPEKISGSWDDWGYIQVSSKEDITDDAIERVKEGYKYLGGKLKE